MDAFGVSEIEGRQFIGRGSELLHGAIGRLEQTTSMGSVLCDTGLAVLESFEGAFDVAQNGDVVHSSVVTVQLDGESEIFAVGPVFGDSIVLLAEAARHEMLGVIAAGFLLRNHR